MTSPDPRPRALVVRALGLGDLLAAVPALRALRAALPEHEVTLAVPSPLASLARRVDAVDIVLPTAELAPVRWHGAPPDVSVDLHGSGPASKHVVACTAPRRIVAFAGPARGGRTVPGPPWRHPTTAIEHERARWCRLVTASFPGVVAHPDEVLVPHLHAPTAPTTPSVPRGAVIVHPGAASGSRRWPPDRFAVVAARLQRAGLPVVVTGSEAERPLAEHVASRALLPEGAVLAGATDVLALARVVADARLVISGDTGVAHLAAAVATPSVTLFGPVSPRLWGPPPGPYRALWAGDLDGPERPGDAHGSDVDPRLLGIEVDEVWGAALGLLGSPEG